jgi:hypothetical protein
MEFLNHYCAEPSEKESERITHILCEAHHLALGENDISVETVSFVTSYIIYLLNCDSILVNEFWKVDRSLVGEPVRTKSVILMLPAADTDAPGLRNSSGASLPAVPDGQNPPANVASNSASRVVDAVENLISLVHTTLSAAAKAAVASAATAAQGAAADGAQPAVDDADQAAGAGAAQGAVAGLVEISHAVQRCIDLAQEFKQDAARAVQSAAGNLAQKGGSAALSAATAAQTTANTVLLSAGRVGYAVAAMISSDVSRTTAMFLCKAQSVISAAEVVLLNATTAHHKAVVSAFAAAATTTDFAIWRNNYYKFADDNTVGERARAIGRILRSTLADALLAANQD